MLEQATKCGWCNKTDELQLMAQGGSVHTVCAECGSAGPILEMVEVRRAYAALRARLAEVEKERDAAMDVTKLATQRLAEAEAHPCALVQALLEIANSHVESHEDARNMQEIARDALAKLEDHDGK